MNKELNKKRVTEWRKRKYDQGCKSLTVYLEPRVREKAGYLRFYYRLPDRSELISMAIETLYQKFLMERDGND